jgi:hypothetical protein
MVTESYCGGLKEDEMVKSEFDEKYPHLAGPIEYKDAPIHFTFVLDGREEPVKIVEPKIDLAFPDGARLLVDEAETRLCDVVFRFDPDADRPYRLKFRVQDEVRHEKGRLLTYCARVARESDMHAVYRETIVNRGNIHAYIEMTRGKARLLVHYLKSVEFQRTPH